MTMNNQELWNRCIEFHGHSCGGLAIGFRAALYAKSLLDLDFSDDEQTVCVAENDSCSVDAVQVVIGPVKEMSMNARALRAGLKGL